MRANVSAASAASLVSLKPELVPARTSQDDTALVYGSSTAPGW